MRGDEGEPAGGSKKMDGGRYERGRRVKGRRKREMEDKEEYYDKEIGRTKEEIRGSWAMGRKI